MGGIVNTAELLREILAETDPATAALVDPLFTSVDEMTKLFGQICFVTKATAEPKPKESRQMGTTVLGALPRLESRTLTTGLR